MLDVQPCVPQDVPTIRRLGVRSDEPKFKPKTVAEAARRIGAFRGSREVSVGASYENLPRRVTEVEAPAVATSQTVKEFSLLLRSADTMTGRPDPVPADTRHINEESEIHLVAAHSESPIATDEEPAKPVKPSPEIVMRLMPVCAVFRVGADMSGAS